MNKLKQQSTWVGLSAIVAAIGHFVVTGSIGSADIFAILNGFGFIAVDA